MLTLKAYAKLNFYLEILGKRADGYHNLQTIMQPIDLYDELIFEPINDDIIDLACAPPFLINKEDNLVYKAARALKDRYGIKEGIKIILRKNIPSGAGLGGGSSDAASTLKALIKVWKIAPLSADQPIKNPALVEIAAQLGADVPFFLQDYMALCEGIGEKISPLKNEDILPIILVNPGFQISTASVFKRVQFPLTLNNLKHKIATLILDEKIDKNGIENVLFNRLEDFVFPQYPQILKIKTLLTDLGCKSLMSGSGSTVFGIAKSPGHLDDVFGNLKKYPWEVWKTRTI